jgi:hypothetical protein
MGLKIKIIFVIREIPLGKHLKKKVKNKVPNRTGNSNFLQEFFGLKNDLFKYFRSYSSNEAAKAKMDKAKEEADEEEKGGLSEQQENSISEEEGRAAIQQLAAIKKLALALARRENGKTKKRLVLLASFFH